MQRERGAHEDSHLRSIARLSLCAGLAELGRPLSPGLCPLSGEFVHGAVQFRTAGTEQPHGNALGIDIVAALEQWLWIVANERNGGTTWTNGVRRNVPEEFVSPAGSGRAFGGAEHGTLRDLSKGCVEERASLVLHVGHCCPGGDDRGSAPTASVSFVLRPRPDKDWSSVEGG